MRLLGKIRHAGHPRCRATRRYVCVTRCPSLVRGGETREKRREKERRERGGQRTNRRDVRASSSRPPAPPPLARPSRARILPYPLTELTGRNGVPLLDVRRARTCTHIAPTDPHELHISSLHMNAAGRPDPPAAIYYRARCLVQFTYDYADAPGSAPTYASAARGSGMRGGREGRAESGGRKRGGGVLALDCDRIRLDRFATFRSRSAVANADS